MTERFLEFEKENHLFSRSIKGVYYWQLIRFSIYNQIILENALGLHPDNTANNVFDKLRFLPYYFKQKIKRNYNNKAKGEIFAIVGYRPVVSNGKVVDPYLGNLCADTGLSVHIHYIYNKNTWGKGEREGSSDNAYLQWEILKKYFFNRLRILFDKNVEKEAIYISNRIDELFAKKIDHKYLKKQIIGSIESFLSAKKHFYKVLDSNCCKCAYIVCHYGTEQFALIDVCRELGIPTIEHQHGTIGRYHIPYNFKDLSSTGKYLPDYLFTYGDYWKQTCRMPDHVELISIGSPFLDEEKERLRGRERSENDVIFYSQGTHGKELSKLAVEFAKMAYPLGFHVVYKLHPNERLTWRSNYPWLAEDRRIEVIDEAISVYEFLASSIYHVGVKSTSLFEAIAFEGKAFVYDIQGSEYMDDMVDHGYARKFTNANELLKLLQENKEAGDMNLMGEQLYLSNSAQRLKKEIFRIIHKEQ